MEKIKLNNIFNLSMDNYILINGYHYQKKKSKFVRKSYDEWLFISAATILDVPENRRSNVEILEKYKPLFGRLIMKFHKG